MYYHIGLPKTGTTFIQSILNDDDRINYQRTSIHKFRPKEVENFYLVNNKVNIVSNETFLLKGEGAAKYNMMKTLSELKSVSAEAKVIVSLREPYSLLLSMFKYRIKNGAYFKSFDDWFFKDEAQDLFSVLHYNVTYQSIMTFFPKEHIYFLFYEDLKNDNLMLKELYKTLNLKPTFNYSKNLNKSLSDTEVIYLNFLNKFFKKQKSMKKYLLKHPPTLIKKNNDFFKSDFETQIKDKLKKDMGSFYEQVSKEIQEKLEKHDYLT